MCDSVVIASGSTTSGGSLFAKNSDRHAGECQPFVQHPAVRYPRAAEVRCTHIVIPQVAESYRVMGHSPWWVWGFEHGVNEYGLAIGNQSVFSREPVEEKPGLIGMDLVRLGLERGRTAREALEVIAGLLESHGQGGSGFGRGEAGYHNSFSLVDPTEAWLLETSGRRWAGRRVDDSSLSNHICLGSDWSIGSRDLESFARTEGWWTSDERLDFARAYRNPDLPGFLSEGRLRRSRDLLEAGRGRHDAASLMDLLRDHGGPDRPPPSEQGDSRDEARYSLCMHAEPVGTTTASMLAELPTDRVAPWPVWISFGSPCMGIFLPVYLDGALPSELARGGGEDSDGSRPGEKAHSAWWIFHHLNEVAARDFEYSLPRLRGSWDEFSERIDMEREGAEREARRMAVAGERFEAAQILSDLMARITSRALVLARELAFEIEQEMGARISG